MLEISERIRVSEDELTERARVARLTRHQHFLFQFGECAAMAECAGSMARRAATAGAQAAGGRILGRVDRKHVTVGRCRASNRALEPHEKEQKRNRRGAQRARAVRGVTECARVERSAVEELHGLGECLIRVVGENAAADRAT